MNFVFPALRFVVQGFRSAGKRLAGAALMCVLAGGGTVWADSNGGSTSTPVVPALSATPSDREIHASGVFAEPLVTVGGKGSPAENATLAAAVRSISCNSTAQERIAAIDDFLVRQPASVWRPGLLVNLGMLYDSTGRWSKAMDAFEQAWNGSKGATDAPARRLADLALGLFMNANARIGRHERLAPLLAEIDGRELIGPGAAHVVGAREGVRRMTTQPGDAFKCGVLALNRMLKAVGKPIAGKTFRKLRDARSTAKGVSLEQLQKLSTDFGLNCRMAKRTPGSEILVPSVVSWKVGHYSAITKKLGNSYLIEDISFMKDTWVLADAIDAESSGYFLVLSGSLPAGWAPVEAAEGGKVWGRGLTSGFTDQTPQNISPTINNGKPCPCGMPQYDIDLNRVNLFISDVPLSYQPPVGPAISLVLRYSQHDKIYGGSCPSIFSSQWSCDWLSFVSPTLVHDPYTGVYTLEGVTVYGPGGGLVTFPSNDPAAGTFPIGKTSMIGISDTAFYVNTFPDGSKRIYGQAMSSGQFWLTSVIDSHGNAITLHYDGSRLTQVVDALGQVTTIGYDPVDVDRIVSVTDPFGRRAIIGYTDDGRVWKITDTAGMSSSVGYGTGDVIDELITPYGSTVFSYDPPDGYAPDRWIEATDPEGGKEAVCYYATSPGGQPDHESTYPQNFDANNCWLNYRNTYYWDKKTMTDAPYDFSRARLIHWLHQAASSQTTPVAPIVESEKRPFENRVWYRYPGQTNLLEAGTSSQPSMVARVLDDGSTQLWQYQYNDLGNVVSSSDPLGRTTTYSYDTNGVDLLEIDRGSGANAVPLAKATYNDKHQPLTVTDAAGQTSSFSYNSLGQILAATDARQRVTTYNYGPNPNALQNGSCGGNTVASVYQVSITGPVADSTTSFGYDGFCRLKTVTGPDAYSVGFRYDGADTAQTLNRLAEIDYPDGSNEQVLYNRLDPEWFKDRLGRWSRTFRDDNRNVIATQDAQGRVTNFDRCTCGALEGLTDPNGNWTGWFRDTQGRLTEKLFADGSVIQYSYEQTTSRLKSITDAKGQVTAFTYNLDDTVNTITYSNPSNPAAGIGRAYSYDRQFGWMTGVSGFDGTGVLTGTVGFRYNTITGAQALGAGQVAGVDVNEFSNGAAARSYSVDYTDADGNPGYDELGRLVAWRIGDNANSAAFDDLGRVSGVTNPLGSFGYSYQGATGRLDHMTLGAVTRLQLAYFGNDHDNLLREIANLDPNGGVVSQFDYTFDAGGNIASWTQANNGSAQQYYLPGHDAADQLTGAALYSGSAGQTSPAPSLLKSFHWDYDNAGNRTNVQVDSAATTFQYNCLNQLTGQIGGGLTHFVGTVSKPALVTVGTSSDPSSNVPATTGSDGRFTAAVQLAPGANRVTIVATGSNPNATGTAALLISSTSYNVTVPIGDAAFWHFDLNGNLVEDAARTYEWDALDRITAINYKGTQKRTEFGYDPLGRRDSIVEKDGATVTSEKHFAWNGSTLCEERDASNTVVRRFYPQGEEIVTGSNSGSYYYTRDHLGSVREMVDSTGVVCARYDYDLWGNRSANLITSANTVEASFGFTGHYFHDRTGFWISPTRLYDPVTGRWISQDPIREEGGINIYGYLGNDPIGDDDPLGLWGANEAYGDWMNIASAGISMGGVFGYSQAAIGILGMTAIDFWGARTLENNAGKSGAASGAGCDCEAIKYGGLAVGQIALSAGGQYAANTLLYPFSRFLGPGSISGFGTGTWLARGSIGEIPYGTIENAVSKLQIPPTSGVNSVVNATKNVWWQYVAGPRTAGGNPLWGAGGGSEYRVGGF